MCVSAVGEFGVIGVLVYLGREVNLWSCSSRGFSLGGGSSISLSKSFFICIILCECNALSVKNVERHITVWWSKA